MILSRVKPNFVASTSRGADAPKLCMPTTAQLADVALPTHHDALLDSDARGNIGRQNTVLVGLTLPFEEVPGWHGHDPGRDALPAQGLISSDRKRKLAAGADEDNLRFLTVFRVG